MRQQEANQFNKGMSLDTNPIALDNQSLTSALNATMITMNGNELVLQNDMGNAQVETAYLPSGYVPVGMKEYGGIVYVASYNPLKGTCQLGSFPSPEQNISGEENGDLGCELNNLLQDKITTYSETAKLLSGPIRPGDQFAVCYESGNGFLSTQLAAGILKLELLIITDTGESEVLVDSENDKLYTQNTHIDNVSWIYNGSNKESNSSRTLHYLNSRLTGSLYLRQTLLLPTSCLVNISSKRDGDDLIVTITPSVDTAYQGLGISYDISGYYKSTEITPMSNTTGSFNLGDANSGKFTYTVTPVYKNCRLTKATKEGTIDLQLLGTGVIEITSFRYYNDTDNGVFSFEYSIQSYLGDNQCLASLDLELTEATFNGTSWDIAQSAKPISLSTAVSFGDNVINMDYSSDGVELGKMYLGRVVAKNATKKETSTGEGSVENANDNSDPNDYGEAQPSDYYWVITSSLTNDYYFQHPTDSMLPEGVELNVPITVTWKDTLLNSDVRPSIIVEEGSLQTADDAKFEYHINPSTILEHKYEASIAYDIDNFPIELGNFVEQEIKEKDDNTYTVSNYYAFSENNKVLDLQIKNDEETIIKSLLPSIKNASQCCVNVTSSFDKETNITKFEATTPAQFIADSIKKTEEFSDTYAIVPYTSTWLSDLYIMNKLFGTDLYVGDGDNNKTTDTSGVGKYFSPTNWLTLKLYESRSKRMRLIVSANDPYGIELTDTIENQESVSYGGDQGDESENGSYSIYKTSTDASWDNWINYWKSYVNGNGQYPTMYMLGSSGGNWDTHCNINGAGETNNYGMPMMFDTSGKAYLFNQVKKYTGSGYRGYLGIINDFIYNFNNIYTLQPNQAFTYNYCKASDTSYSYNKQYSVTINYSLENNVDIKNAINSGTNDYLAYPKFKVTVSNQTQTYTYTVSSVDISSKAQEYLEASPTLGNVALIKKNSAECSYDILTKAYNPNTKTSESFNSSHVYYKISDTKLVDCNTYNIAQINDAINSDDKPLGYYIANLVNLGILFYQYNSDLDYNTFYVNSSKLKSNKIQTTKFVIGRDKTSDSGSGDLTSGKTCKYQLLQESASNKPATYYTNVNNSIKTQKEANSL